MFGSKLRSWMENHIVRPRKKGNKNKTGTSGNNFGVLTAQNGYKGGTFTSDSTIGSPARRSEVSPIQNHTTGRRGWHSPNQDNAPISPKSDHFPIHHRLPNGQAGSGGAQHWLNAPGTVQTSSAGQSSSRQHQQQPLLSSPKSISRNGSSYTLEPGPANVCYSKSVDSFADGPSLPCGMPEFDFRSAAKTGPTNAMPGAGPVSAVGQSHDHLVPHSGHPSASRGHYSTATSSSNELLEDLHSLDAAHRIKRLHPATSRISSSSSSSVGSSHQNNANNNLGPASCGSNNNNHMPNGGTLVHYATANGMQPRDPPANGNSKYGKLHSHQPSKQYGASTYYDQQQQHSHHHQHHHLQHNGINNNPAYPSLVPVSASGGAEGSMGTPPPSSRSSCGSPLPRPACPTGNRITNGNTNGNNNNSVHFEASTKGGGSLTASFASKFHKLTGGRSNGANVTDASSGNKLNHVNNNNNGGGVAGPHHNYQINNTTTHLHPASGLHQPLSTAIPPTQSSSSSASSPPPPAHPGSSHHHLHQASAAHGPHHHHHHTHGVHPLGHTLSSPESAYSTGYSTDGTSPGGCSYTPEYYINIRTGTHYFPKGTTLPGSLHGRGPALLDRVGAPGTESGTKFKCALNRIEEKHVEFCVDTEKLVPASRSNNVPAVAPSLSSFKPAPGLSQPQQQQQPSATGQASPAPPTPAQASLSQTAQPPNAVAMSPVMQKNLGMQHYRSIESPSPRQRCRIRTNPWLTTADGALASNCLKRTEQDSGSTSSGIKSSSGTDDNKNDTTNKANALSDTDSSSSTEKIVNKKMLTPRSLKKACDFSRLDSRSAPVTIGSNQESDEDATLNEMMGKFDESYHYEKETDILSCSDSDPTDCPTDIDTGQDAGDECDTDDLLDLDFIDTGSVQEVPDKEDFRHTASCSIHQLPERTASGRQRSLKSKRTIEGGGGSRRRKKLVRTRKKPACDGSTAGAGGVGASGDHTGVVGRGCRSLGGTPVSLRRNQPDAEHRTPARSSPLTNRCNSLTFTEVHSLHSRILAISESEKALLKADLEADVKYRQLIHEAETILFSMKSNSSISIKEPPPPLPPREPSTPAPPAVAKEPSAGTTIASPRRVCNPPANKRVEMLRNCEADLRRELAKTCSQKCADGVGHPAELNPAEGVIINKRLEVLRYETSCSVSAPSSPKNTRVLLPRKTHLSNFMHHQAPANDLRTSANPSSPPPPPPRLVSKSPTIIRRRFRSQSPHLNIESDSDSDDVSRNLDCKGNGKTHRNSNLGSSSSNKENLAKHSPGVAGRTVPPPPPPRRDIAGKQMNNFRHTIHGPAGPAGNGEDANNGHGCPGTGVDAAALANGVLGGMHKSPLISFRSLDIGSPVADDSYCPQSEPLKRKIYTCSAAFEKIQRSLDQDPELSKKALLERISLLRRERQLKSPRREHEASAPANNTSSSNYCTAADADSPDLSKNGHCEADSKQQLIMDTLAEIKRSLENQSVELNEFNDSDN